MGLNEKQKEIAINVWNEYNKIGVEFYNANKIVTPEEIDNLRMESIPTITNWINDYLQDEVALEEFKTAIDGLNKRNPYWGFKGVNGQMFFNMITKTCLAHNRVGELDQVLKKSITSPLI